MIQTYRVAIVGAGLAGLYAAYLLEKQGITDYIVLEAKHLPGGRIASTPTTGHSGGGVATGGFDLGPTWFWPGFQTEMDLLVRDLGLERFAQFDDGDMLIERSPSDPPSKTRGYPNSPPSMRLVGGMSALIQALHQRLDGSRVVTGQVVRRLRLAGSHIEMESKNSEGLVTTWSAGHVLLALPPRLAERQLSFSPTLPLALARQWRDTATWMAPHAKYIALYDDPFWREQGLSGEARSAVGPLVEIHDASMPGGRGALFGFFGVPVHVRKDIPEEQLRAHCRSQLVRLFGRQAATPAGEFIKDWAQDLHVATDADQEPSGHHASAPATTAETGPWSNYVIGIASEWSPRFPGYLAGALDAAKRGVAALR